MARFNGEIGYGESFESPAESGVWTHDVIERVYSGDVLQNTRRLEDGVGLNQDIAVSNRISVVADEYAIQNFMKILYIRWMGILWTVSNVAVQSPRLVLTLGSVYNGPTP